MRLSTAIYFLLLPCVFGDITTLEPFKHVTAELLELDTAVRSYRLAGLQPNTGYEVRLSWPATIPATIKVLLVDGAGHKDKPEGSLTRRLGRRLLDCEKLEFRTDDQGTVQGFQDPVVLVSAFRRSVHRDGPAAGVDKIIYDIVLAEFVFGSIPRDALPVVAAVVIAVLVALFWSLYWSISLYPKIVTWLTAEHTNDKTTSTKQSAGGAAKEQ